MSPPVSVGDRAPEIALAGTGGRTYCLSSCRGATVVLVFYPGDNTAVCTRQLCAYSADLPRFEGLGATMWAISPQGVDSHERFASGSALGMALLADTGREVGRAYGVVGPGGLYRRSVFVVDAQGVVRYAHRGLVGLTFKPGAELLAAVRAAGGGPGATGDAPT